ncbi:MAG: TerB family tellurite resistance protein [Rhizobiaceae bacterium]
MAGVISMIRTLFDGDPGIRRVADDPALTAELLLLFRMILADGDASAAEMAVFRRICRDGFGIPERSIEGVVDYLNETGYETTGSQAVAMFAELSLERRRLLVVHMAEIAKADAELAERELRLLGRTLALLGLRPEDAIDHPGTA